MIIVKVAVREIVTMNEQKIVTIQDNIRIQADKERHIAHHIVIFVSHEINVGGNVYLPAAAAAAALGLLPY